MWQDPSKVNQGVLALWLKNNTNVSAAEWGDASSVLNGTTDFTVGQSDASLQASLEDGGLNFEGSSNHHYDLPSDLTIAEEEGFIIFLVIKLESFDTQNALFGTSDNGVFMELQTERRIRIKTAAGVDITEYPSSNQFGIGEKCILTLQRERGDVGNINVMKNGTLLTPTSQVANTGEFVLDVLGTRNNDRFFDGVIYEALIYSQGSLDAGSIVKVNSYLRRKFGI